MRSPRWLSGVPQPLRAAVVGCIALAVVGAGYGLVESARDYPVSSWFGVTLYLLMLGALAGFVLGVVLGAVWMLVRWPARRQVRPRP